MKRKQLRFLLSAVLVVWVGAVASQAVGIVAPKKTKLKFPNGKAISVDLALTPEEQETGLMFRTELPKDYGMLFVFAKQQPLQFWMKNTWVDLDMIFIDEKKRITVIYRKVPRSYPETPEGSVARRNGQGQYVLELPAGGSDRYHLKVGGHLSFALGPNMSKN